MRLYEENILGCEESQFLHVSRCTADAVASCVCKLPADVINIYDTDNRQGEKKSWMEREKEREREREERKKDLFSSPLSDKQRQR